MGVGGGGGVRWVGMESGVGWGGVGVRWVGMSESVGLCGWGC